MQADTKNEMLKRIADGLTQVAAKTGSDLNSERIASLLGQCFQVLKPEDASKLMSLTDLALIGASQYRNVEVTEVRPAVLECDVVRFQNNKEKWVALVGLLDGYPYEIFTGLQDDDEGIILPKTVTHGKIIKQMNPDGSKRYDFQFENKRGYKTTVEGLSEKFNPEYWNYAKLISGVLRYGMPLEHVVRLVGSLSLKDESINTWKTGVERALKKYIPGIHDEEDSDASEGTGNIEP
jgi:ribonucleoside-diphosphate reductase alpha chain